MPVACCRSTHRKHLLVRIRHRQWDTSIFIWGGSHAAKLSAMRKAMSPVPPATSKQRVLDQ